MSFHKDQMFNEQATPVTADGASAELQVGPGTYDITIDVMAVSGTTPTLNTKVQESNDGSTYNDLAAFPQITATGAYALRVTTKKEWLQLLHDVGGTTPSFTLNAGPTIGQDGAVE